MAYKFQIGSAILSGALSPTDDSAFDLGASGKEWKDLYVDGTAYVDAINYNGTAITANAAELNKLASCTVTTAELNKLNGSTSNSAANKLIILDANGDFEMQDNDKIHFGDGADANIHWDGNSLEVGNADININIGGTTSEVTFGDNVTVTGDLTVQGTTTTVNSTNIDITGSFRFEGNVPDDFETVFSVVNPTADRVINLADAAGTVVPFAAAPSAGVNITSTPTELNLLDAVTRGSIIYGNASGVSARLAKGGTGAVLQSDGTDISYGLVANANVDANAAIAFTKLADLSDANILVGNASDKAASVAMSGDIAINNAGLTTIQANAVEGSMLNNNIVSGLTDIGAAIADTDEMIVSDNGTIRRTDMSRLKTFIGEGSMSIFSLSGSGTVDGVIAAASGSGFYHNHAVADPDGLGFESKYFLSGSGWSTGANLRIKAPPFDANGKVSIFAQSASGGDFIHVIDGFQGRSSGSVLAQLGTNATDIPAVTLDGENAALSLILFLILSEGGLTEYHWSIM